MNELIIRIESIDAMNERIVDAVESGKAQPQSYSFESYAAMQATLTPNRMAILQALMAADEALGLRELARRIELNHANVNRDLQKLLDARVVVKDDAGRYRVEFTSIRFDVRIGAAA